MPDYNDAFTYGVRKIQKSIETVRPVVAFFKDRYFSNQIESELETVSIETKRGNRIILPSVRRNDSAIKIGSVAPHQVHTYTPPYNFLEASATISDANKRVFGEPVETPYSKADRMQVIIAERLNDGMRGPLLLNEEAQCSQIIKTGKVTPKGYTVNGDLFNFPEIDFNVDADLVGGALNSLWTTSSDIIKEIQTICIAVFKKTGRMPTEMVVGSRTLAVMLGASKFTSALDNRRIEGNMIRASQYAGYPGVSVNGTVNVPMVGDLMILSYVNDYQYSGGDAVDMIDANGLLLTTPGWGTMAYAGLYDQVGGYPTMVAGKNLVHAVQGDVSNHFVYKAFMQTASLAIPTTLDAWYYKTVVA